MTHYIKFIFHDFIDLCFGQSLRFIEKPLPSTRPIAISRVLATLYMLSLYMLENAKIIKCDGRMDQWTDERIDQLTVTQRLKESKSRVHATENDHI